MAAQGLAGNSLETALVCWMRIVPTKYQEVAALPSGLKQQLRR